MLESGAKQALLNPPEKGIHPPSLTIAEGVIRAFVSG